VTTGPTPGDDKTCAPVGWAISKAGTLIARQQHAADGLKPVGATPAQPQEVTNTAALPLSRLGRPLAFAVCLSRIDLCSFKTSPSRSRLQGLISGR